MGEPWKIEVVDVRVEAGALIATGRPVLNPRNYRSERTALRDLPGECGRCLSRGVTRVARVVSPSGERGPWYFVGTTRTQHSDGTVTVRINRRLTAHAGEVSSE